MLKYLNRKKTWILCIAVTIYVLLSIFSRVYGNQIYYFGERLPELRHPDEYIMDGIKICEGSDPAKNVMGIMCWNKNRERYLCRMTEEEARAKVKQLLIKSRGATLLAFLKIYAPPGENSYTYYYCVAEKSGLKLNSKL